MDISKIFDEVLNEASIGRVFIDDKIYNVHFYTTPKDDMIPVLNIENKDELIKAITQYLEAKNSYNIKKDIAFLFINATYENFKNPISFVKLRTSFLKNKLSGNVTYLEDEIIESETINCNEETPYYFKSTISNGIFSYDLPLISYGISDDTCYIYAVQDKNKFKDTSYGKKIKRMLYKANENGEILDVSPSNVIALSIFLKKLYDSGIYKVKVVPFLPIRYFAKEEALIKKANYFARDIEEITGLLKEYAIKSQQIQNNITQKFILNFYRINVHFPNVHILNEPDLDECINIKIEEFKKGNNSLLNKIILKDIEFSKK